MKETNHHCQVIRICNCDDDDGDGGDDGDDGDDGVVIQEDLAGWKPRGFTLQDLTSHGGFFIELTRFHFHTFTFSLSLSHLTLQDLELTRFHPVPGTCDSS